MKRLLKWFAWLLDWLALGPRRRMEYFQKNMQRIVNSFRDQDNLDNLLCYFSSNDVTECVMYSDDNREAHVVMRLYQHYDPYRFYVHLWIRYGEDKPCAMAITECAFEASKDLKRISVFEGKSILVKAMNIKQRFQDFIQNFWIENDEYKVEYRLGYETKTFTGYYKNNNLKKKLIGAQAFVRDNETKLFNLVNNINTYYANFGSKLKLEYKFGVKENGSLLRNFSLSMNGYEFLNTEKMQFGDHLGLLSAYEKLEDPSIENTLKCLMSSTLVKIKTPDEKIFLCHVGTEKSAKWTIFKPIFSASASCEGIYTTTAYILETFEKRTLHHGSISVSNLQKDI